MSKTTGLGERLYINQYDLYGDVGAIASMQSTRNQQDVTTLQDYALERLGLLYDGHRNCPHRFTRIVSSG